MECIRLEYDVDGNNFSSAGNASDSVKRTLKQLGVSPASVRRVAIAMYEGEINMVIHAHGGRAEVEIYPDYIDIYLKDSGPGIADIDLAMKAGYSTAYRKYPQPRVRRGHGAAEYEEIQRRNEDRFSTVGVGTTVLFEGKVLIARKKAGRTALRALRGTEKGYHGRVRIWTVTLKTVVLDSDKCIGCITCMRRCPTEAIRIENGKAKILYDKCINCGECVRSCKGGAKRPVYDSFELVSSYKYKIALPSPSLFGQFNNLTDPNYVIEGLSRAGFRRGFRGGACGRTRYRLHEAADE